MASHKHKQKAKHSASAPAVMSPLIDAGAEVVQRVCHPALRDPAFALPLPLPEYPEDRAELIETMGGPTYYANWVIKDRLIMGAVPKKSELLIPLLEHGVTTFVCLMTDVELKNIGTHYIEKATNLYNRSPETYQVLQQRLDILKKKKEDIPFSFIHVPIYDKQTVRDEIIIDLVFKILRLLAHGEKMLVHCLGGHGRSGVVICVLLGLIYDLDSFSAIDLCQKLHDCRAHCIDNESVYTTPQTHDQKNQVHRILSQISVPPELSVVL